MSTIDPTLVPGDAALAADVEYSLEDVAQALADGGAVEAEAVPAAPMRIQVGRIVEAPPEEVSALLPAQPIVPAPQPVPVLVRRKVSGRYRSAGGVQLELRVDVDARRPLRRVSGDFYVQSGATLNYFGSFIVHAPAISIGATTATIDGIGVFTWAAGFPRVRVTIPRNTIFNPPGTAAVQFLTVGGAPGASYTCPFVSAFYRTVQIEEDCVPGVTPFNTYHTGSLPAPPPARALSVAGAYAEAGIQMQSAGVRNVVPLGPYGASWSNAELHHAMQANFSLWQNVPQWKVWLLHAQLHDNGPGLLGIMFDQQGPQRQGCAVFYAGVGGAAAARQRSQLYVCVHELGHCFNLFHSFHKQYMNPPQPNRLNALSWMNYPWGFPGGEAAFWNTFPFQFDDPELVHMRHAFRNNIVMGGNPFGTGAALEHPEQFAEPVEDYSGLRLELRGRTSYQLGEPVDLEFKLETTDLRGREVHANLHPDYGYVQVAIRHPSGRVTMYRPMLEQCILPAMVRLGAGQPSVYESAYLGYGKDGLYFDAPGRYELRAVYHAPDDSRVVSNTFALRVRSPLDREDDEVAELLLGEEQGQLFYLLGSDSRFLSRGNEALDHLVEEHGDHPLAVYGHLVRGVNAAREFKTITPDGKVEARAPDYTEAATDLNAVVTASEAGQGLGNISLNLAMRTLADVQEARGDEELAARTARRMLEHFRGKDLKPHVLELIERQAAAYEPGAQHLDAATRRARANRLDHDLTA